MVMVKAYQKYKDTKLTWLAKVPETWQILRGKTVFRCIDMRSKDGSEELLSVSSKDGVVPRSSKKITMFMAESYAGYKLCWPGDLVINSLWAWMFGLGFSRHHGIVSSAYGVYRTRSQYLDHWQYFDYLIRSKAYAWELRVRSQGIWTSRLQLTDDRFLDMPILIPPKEEAIEIAKFLSVLDIQIRRYIREKQKVIKLLNEQKQAVINRAITKGVDTDVRLKPSGIDWIGDIPEDWRLFRVKQCSKKISKGTTPSTENREILSSGSIRFLKAENLSDGKITENPAFFIDKETNSILRRSQLEENDVLFVIAGATIGKSAVVRQENLPSNTNQAVAFIRPNNLVLANYLHLWLGSPRIKEMTWLNAVQSAQPNLSMADLGNFLMPLPSLDEQDCILKRLEESLKPIQVAIAYAYKQIEMISEYRNRLVLDAVTGKIDVRDIKLPEIEDVTNSETIEDQETLEDVEDIEEVVNADE